VDGTLARRFAQLPFPRAVRAKTGTLDGVIALSGYVLGPAPGRDLAFSFIANGVKGKHQTARELVDAIVTQLSRYLYSPARAPRADAGTP
jgi:D-alanyl-D-alanine carboxypeptidase/D-alanyl-D-alanine-endopeptidase (penicillin-binding protein 4)